MPYIEDTPSLTDKGARALAKTIAKESDGVRVKFGKTNGRVILHVIAPGNGAEDQGPGSRVVRNAGDWETHPSNRRVIKAKNETAVKAAEKESSDG